VIENEEHEERESELSPAEQRARVALASAPVERADREFRDRLKRDFVSGAIEVTGAKERRRVAVWRGARAIAGTRTPRRVYLPPAAWVGVSLAAAALLTIVFGALNQGPRWWVTAARGDGAVRIEGQTVALDDRDALRRLLVPGAEVETGPNAELDLCSSGVLALQLAPGTRMTLPPPPARWIGRSDELWVRAGVLRVTTGPRFSGVRLAVMSPTAAVMVTGTTFAVIIEDAGTCVCVYEGTASVGRRVDGESTDMSPVPGGQRRYVYKGGRPPEMADMRDEERGKLAQFREAQRPWMQGTITPE
jgi:hypothetical protein